LNKSELFALTKESLTDYRLNTIYPGIRFPGSVSVCIVVEKRSIKRPVEKEQAEYICDLSAEPGQIQAYQKK
jgi:hypothetical protein